MNYCGTYYLNDDHTIEPCDTATWGLQLEVMRKEDGKHVKDEVVNEHRISTVWLGLDHECEDGMPPLLFETMIFSPGTFSEIYCDRYSTWDEAVAGHERAKEKFLAGEIE